MMEWAGWPCDRDFNIPVQITVLYRLYSMSSRLTSLYAQKGRVSLVSHVIRFVSYLPKVGGSLWVLRIPPPVTLTAAI